MSNLSEEEKKANKKIYLCDVEKNKECNKRYCYINGGPCNATRDKTKAINNMSGEKIIEIMDIIDNIFLKQVNENEGTKLWFEINYDDTQKLKQATQGLLDLYKKQQKEIEELKKGNKSLMDSRKKWKDRYYKEKGENKTLKQCNKNLVAEIEYLEEKNDE